MGGGGGWQGGERREEEEERVCVCVSVHVTSPKSSREPLSMSQSTVLIQLYESMDICTLGVHDTICEFTYFSCMHACRHVCWWFFVYCYFYFCYCSCCLLLFLYRARRMYKRRNALYKCYLMMLINCCEGTSQNRLSPLTERKDIINFGWYPSFVRSPSPPPPPESLILIISKNSCIFPGLISSVPVF